MGVINFTNQNREISKEYFRKALYLIFKDEQSIADYTENLKNHDKTQRDEALGILIDLFKDEKELIEKLVSLQQQFV